MSQKNNKIRAWALALFAICFVWIAVVFCAFTPSPKHHFIPTSDGENFLTLQQKYARSLEHTILKLLEPLVGRGHVQASVQVELNLKNAKHHIRAYNPKLDSEVISRQTFEKEIRNLIEKLNISVIVDGSVGSESKGIYRPRTAQEMTTYRRLIQSATGYNVARGDTLEIQNMPFIAKAITTPHVSLLIPFAVVLFVLGFIFVCLSICPVLCAAKDKKEPISYSTDLLDKITENPARAITVLKNWIYMPVRSKDSDWTPIQKVGITLLALDENIVRQILVALDDNEVRQVAKTMTSLGVIPPKESARILTELYEAMKNGSAVVGNPARVQQILSESTNEETLKFKETLQTPNASLWKEVAGLDTEHLTSRLVALRPEIIAYILYRLPATKSSELLQDFTENKATQVIIHLSHIGHVSANTQAKMEQEAVMAAREILNTIHTPSGTEKTSEILAQMSQTKTGQAVLKDLNEKEPFLARKLSAKLIRFEDIAHWSQPTIQTILRNTPKAAAILALVDAPDGVQKAIQQNVPETLWPSLHEEITSMKKRATQDQIEDARRKIVENIRLLLDQGKIQL